MDLVVVSRDIPASASQIWVVIRDLSNIADCNRGVKKSYSTNGQNEGVGAARHCDLLPAGEVEVEETIQGWTPNEQLVVSVDSSKKSPIKSALATFDLTSGGDAGNTTVTATVKFEPKWGPIGWLMNGIVENQLTKAFGDVFRDLETTVTPAA